MKISLVIPVYNEELTIPIFCDAVANNSFLKQQELELVFVNDGSKDRTLEILQDLTESFNQFKLKVINRSRNFGKEPALFAGLSNASGEVVIPIDVDLQNPIEVIELLCNEHRNGFDVVLAKRADRSDDTALKRFTAVSFYKLNNKIADVKLENKVGDFRLLHRKVVDEILKMPENQPFMKGVLSWHLLEKPILNRVRDRKKTGNTTDTQLGN